MQNFKKNGIIFLLVLIMAFTGLISCDEDGETLSEDEITAANTISLANMSIGLSALGEATTVKRLNIPQEIYMAMAQGTIEQYKTGKISSATKKSMLKSLLSLQKDFTKKTHIRIIPAALTHSGTSSSFTIGGNLNGPQGGTVDVSGSGSLSSSGYTIDLTLTYNDYAYSGYAVNGESSFNITGSSSNFSATFSGNLAISGNWSGTLTFDITMSYNSGSLTVTGTVNGIDFSYSN